MSPSRASTLFNCSGDSMSGVDDDIADLDLDQVEIDLELQALAPTS
jgi:hypothetical protein